LKFQKEIDPYFEKIFYNQSQIRTLEKLRDALLPKLMSGEVRVASTGFESGTSTVPSAPLGEQLSARIEKTHSLSGVETSASRGKL